MFTLLPKGVKKKLILFLLKFAICHLKRSKWDTQGRGRSWYMKKIWNQKSHGTVPLNFLLHVQNCTYWKLQILAVMPCQWKLYPMTMNLQVPPAPPPPTHTHLRLWRICQRGGWEFIRNAAKMFSFDPIPTRTKKAWSSSTCLLYASQYLVHYRDHTGQLCPGPPIIPPPPGKKLFLNQGDPGSSLLQSLYSIIFIIADLTYTVLTFF